MTDSGIRCKARLTERLCRMWHSTIFIHVTSLVLVIVTRAPRLHSSACQLDDLRCRAQSKQLSCASPIASSHVTNQYPLPPCYKRSPITSASIFSTSSDRTLFTLLYERLPSRPSKLHVCRQYARLAPGTPALASFISWFALSVKPAISRSACRMSCRACSSSACNVLT